MSSPATVEADRRALAFDVEGISAVDREGISAVDVEGISAVDHDSPFEPFDSPLKPFEPELVDQTGIDTLDNIQVQLDKFEHHENNLVLFQIIG